ncbi:hypothetical protein KSP39_PZI015963 [Platanthera zijinensis]|uniref:Uncharacterized protein n=1 Tax=Platanthera zijinensis TaxID=2320716 RepID=A0AAP0B9Z9_9ASPA
MLMTKCSPQPEPSPTWCSKPFFGTTYPSPSMQPTTWSSSCPCRAHHAALKTTRHLAWLSMHFPMDGRAPSSPPSSFIPNTSSLSPSLSCSLKLILPPSLFYIFIFTPL